MRLVIEGSKPVEDSYRYLEDGIVPDSGDVILYLQHWQQTRVALAAHQGRVGVALSPDDDPELLADDLPALDLIVLEFPQFTDGRAYSQARVLRERLGFAGKLRARGDILADQIDFMRRCGIKSFEFDDRPAAERAVGRQQRFSVAYQRDASGPLPAYRHRG